MWYLGGVTGLILVIVLAYLGSKALFNKFRVTETPPPGATTSVGVLPSETSTPLATTLVAVLLTETNTATSQTPLAWKQGNLEIHIFNVGQGDSQLIIGPTGKTLLIDIAEPNWNTNSGATWVADEIRRITGGSHLDYVMVSHWHLGQIGYPGGGIWSLLEQQEIYADVLIDRDGGVWNEVNRNGVCDPTTEIIWHNSGLTTGTIEKWVCWATDPLSIITNSPNTPLSVYSVGRLVG